jgi:hypothetical protein
MGSINKALETLRNAAEELLGEISALDTQISECQRRRDAIASATVSKADYMEYIKADIERQGRIFAKQIALEVEGKRRDYGTLERNKHSGIGERLPYLTGRYAVPVPITEEAVFFYFGDLIAERLGDALDGVGWPNDAIPAAQRAKLIAELEAEIASLKQRRDALAAQLTQAGMAG